MLCQSRGSTSQPAPGSAIDSDFLKGLKSEDFKKDDQLEKNALFSKIIHSQHRKPKEVFLFSATIKFLPKLQNRRKKILKNKRIRFTGSTQVKKLQKD